MTEFDPTAPRGQHSTRRRTLLGGLGAAASWLAAGSGILLRPSALRSAELGTPFTLGVASGDPAHDGFVIWTKLAPRPLELGGGMPKKTMQVQWTLATDPGLRQVVRHGTHAAHPELGHAVHVEIAGLEAAREYYYCFALGGERSDVGRAKTLPAPGTNGGELRFAAAGCQKYEDGYYTAWRHIAAERLDFVFHYGDYIYEYNTAPGSRKLAVIRSVPGVSDESYTLDEYRQRYAAYKLDPDLQAAHASAPFVMSFDDHEVDNNWAGDHSAQKHTPRALFLLRRAAAFQAWYEHMPLRAAQLPRGPDILAYRRLIAGNLLALNVLDTRQYRSPQACGGGTKTACAEALDPRRTMLGDAQERWLYEGFGDATRWTALAQQVPFARRDHNPDPAVYGLRMDKWDGAAAARERVLAAAEAAKLANLVVVSGDLHNNCVSELKKDFTDERSPTLGVEFVATSISSGGDGFDTSPRLRALLQTDTHIKLYNNQRGYVRHVVSADRWQADLRVLDKVSVPDGRVSTLRSFVLEHGRPGFADA